MKQSYKLNENELKSLIAECVQEVLNEEENEGFLRNVGGALRNAFGGDVNRIQSGARSVGNNIKNGVKRAGNAITTAAKNVNNAVSQTAQNVQRGVSDRYNAAKAGFQAGQYNDKIDKLMNLITSLQNDGILTGNAMNGAINTIMTQLKQAKGRNNANASAFKNAIGQQ